MLRDPSFKVAGCLPDIDSIAHAATVLIDKREDRQLLKRVNRCNDPQAVKFKVDELANFTNSDSNSGSGQHSRLRVTPTPQS